jgi:hypothetical protein
LADNDTLRQLFSAEAAGTPFDVNIAALNNVVTKRPDECQNNRCKSYFYRCNIILRDKAAKVLAWLDKLKQFGNIVANLNMKHFALPWAGVGLLLDVSHKHIRHSDFLLLLDGRG